MRSLSLDGRLCTTDDISSMRLHPTLSSTALTDSQNSSPVQSLMLSSHLFLCLPLLLVPLTVPCRVVLAMPEALEI